MKGPREGAVLGGLFPPLLLGLIVFVPAWGLYGAVAAKLVANVAGFLVIGVAIGRAWRQLPQTESSSSA